MVPGLSPYHFGFNNPVRYSDPLGLMGDDAGMWGTGNAYGSYANGTKKNPWGSFTGAGSGHHWSDQYRDPYHNWMSMGSSTFNGFYGLDPSSDTYNEDFLSLVGSSCNCATSGSFKWIDYPSTVTGNIYDGSLTVSAKASELAFVEQTGGSVGQPGTWESMIPIWGSGRAAVDYFQNENYWSAAGYAALAISDVFLVKSIVTGVAKGGVKMFGKSYKTWGSYRTNYGKTGFAAPNQQLHHWAWARNGAKSGEGAGWWAKNQMWNLMPMESQAMHSAVHGWGRNAYGPVGQFWYGTPTWFKASIVSGGGRLAD